MPKQTYILFITIALLIFSSCKRNGCDVGNNQQVSKTYELEYFNFLKSEGVFYLELVQDTQNLITITCPEVFLENILYAITDSILLLENFNSCYFLHHYEKVQLELHVVDLRRIQLGQPVIISSRNALTQNIFIEALGEYAELDLELAGNVWIYNNGNSRGIFKLSGYSDHAILYVHGGAILDARNLNARYAECNNYSVADLYVGDVEILEYSINSNANIYYREAEKIVLKTSLNGEGKLLQLSQP